MHNISQADLAKIYCFFGDVIFGCFQLFDITYNMWVVFWHIFNLIDDAKLPLNVSMMMYTLELCMKEFLIFLPKQDIGKRELSCFHSKTNISEIYVLSRCKCFNFGSDKRREIKWILLTSSEKQEEDYHIYINTSKSSAWDFISS